MGWIQLSSLYEYKSKQKIHICKYMYISTKKFKKFKWFWKTKKNNIDKQIKNII